MKKISIIIAACSLIVASFSGSAFATPSTIGIGSFSGSETVVNFNNIGNETQITNQFSGQGVVFSGALYGMTNSGDTSLFPSNGGGVISSNWLYTKGNQGLTFEADFTSSINRIGFYLENWPNQSATLEIFNGASSLGSIAFNTSSLTAEFVGLESISSFDRLVFTNTASNNGFYAIDDFRFESTNSAPVPEPSTFALIGFGLAGLGLIRRKMKK